MDFVSKPIPKDVSHNVRDFTRRRRKQFWQLIWHVVPWQIVVHVAAIAMPLFDFMSLSDYFLAYAAFNVLIAALNGYLLAVIAVSWHRLVINGSENYRIMDPFFPRWHEIQFMLLLAALNVLFYVLAFGGGVLLPLVHSTLYDFLPVMVFNSVPSAMVLMLGSMFFGVFLSIFISFKCPFYFPAKAANRAITLKESFRLTRGHFWNILVSCICALWRVFFCCLLYSVFSMFVLSEVLVFLTDNVAILSVTHAIILLPFLIYFEPMILVISVSVISNYYLEATKNDEPYS